ncbi:MAG: FGGY family carbohydrate kinase [Actinomycetota bacterium]
MTEDLLLGLDVGTEFTKAAAVTLDGVERSHGRAWTPWRAVPTGAEMDPAAMVDAALAAARDALKDGAPGRVVGVGVTSMAETGVLLDTRGDPVGPMIAWYDTRGDPQAAELAEAFGADRFSERTGLPVSRMCSLSKYRWMRAHLPETKRGVRWLNVAEWMVRSLGGRDVAELSLSSRTGFWDLGARRAWDEVLGWAEAPIGLLPEPVEAGTPVGKVSGPLEQAEGAVLTVSGHDHPCAMVGSGATRPGDVFDSCGTAEAFVRAVEPHLPSDAIRRAVAQGVTVGWHVVHGQLGLIAGFVSGLALQRFLDLLGVDAERRGELDAATLRIPSGAEGVVVRDVISDRATLEGIHRSATPAHVWRAALEAVSRHGAEVLATIESVAGDTGRLVVTGGWVRSPAFHAVKREVLGLFEEPEVEEAGARGAALIAGIAAGVYRDTLDLPPVRWRTQGR